MITSPINPISLFSRGNNVRCRRHTPCAVSAHGVCGLPSHRPGLTLFEVLLTLCLLVVIAAVVWPSLGKSFSIHRLRKAADQVHIGWCKARLKAMGSGCILVFRYEVGGNKYRLDAQAAGAVSSQSDLMVSSAANYGPEANFAGNTNPQNNAPLNGAASSPGITLPDGVFFLSSEILPDTRAMAAISNMSPPEAGWSEPIFFYPDGTTSTAQLLLRNKEDRLIELFLRGLTGVVTVGNVTTTQERGLQQQ